MRRAILAALLAAVLGTAPGCQRAERNKCLAGAIDRGQIELKCARVRARWTGSRLTVYGCGKHIVFYCQGPTPLKASD